MLLKCFVLLIVILGIGCTEIAIKPVKDKYHLTDRRALYQLKKWSFEGRLALSNAKKSWTTKIEWTHTLEKDTLKLSGPLGQNAIMIILTENEVVLKQGDDKIQQSDKINSFIEQQSGLAIPVKSLRYWVLGLVDPNETFVELADGFQQQQWIVQYLQMQQFDKKWMPRKLKALQNQTRLKLIIDHWML